MISIFSVLITSFGISIPLVLFLNADSQSTLIKLLLVLCVISVLLIKSPLRNILASYQKHLDDKRLLAVYLIVALIISMYFYQTPFVLLMMCNVLLYSIVCLGLTVQFGFTGIINFAAAAFFGIGGYSTVLLTQLHIPSLLVIPLAGCISMIFGSVLIIPVLKTRGHYAALITIAAGILFKSFLEVNDTLGGPQGLQVPSISLFGFDFNNPITVRDTSFSFYLPYILLCTLIFIVLYFVTNRIEKSWFGLTLDVVRTDETAASTFGISIRKWKISAFLIGNFFIGVAGSVNSSVTGFIAPNNFTFSDSLLMISIVILGGIGNIKSILPATLIMIMIPEKLQFIQEYRFLIYALLIISILLFRPNGLFPRGIRNFSK